MTTIFHEWPCGRFIEIQSSIRRKKIHRTNQGSNFLGGSFRNRDNPTNIRLGEDLPKTSWRRLHCNIFLSSRTSLRRFQDIITRRLLEDVLQTHLEDVMKTPWKRVEDVLQRRLEDVFGRRIGNTSSRRLGRRKIVTLKRSWTLLVKQEMFAGNVRVPIQFSRESQPQQLKRWFFLKNRPIHFHINSAVLLNWSNKTSCVFPALKSISHFPSQSTVPRRSDSSSEANSSCYHRSDAWSHLK